MSFYFKYCIFSFRISIWFFLQFLFTTFLFIVSLFSYYLWSMVRIATLKSLLIPTSGSSWNRSQIIAFCLQNESILLGFHRSCNLGLYDLQVCMLWYEEFESCYSFLKGIDLFSYTQISNYSLGGSSNFSSVLLPL